MYTIYGSFRSRTLRVLWMLEELGVNYKHIPTPPHDVELQNLNPAGKIPVMVAEGTAITDSVAIMTFLADKHNAMTFQAGSLNRAKQDSFTHQICDEVDSVLWAASRHKFVLPEEKRIPELWNVLNWELSKAWDALNLRLGDGPNLMGDEFTIADILLTHCGGWARAGGFNMPDNELGAYFKRQISRPAYKRMFKSAVASEAK